MSMPVQSVRSYRLASSDTLVNLEKAVNQGLAAGWQPYGAPFLTHDHRLVQALILPAGVKPAAGAAPIPAGISAVAAPPVAAPPVQPQHQQQPQPPAQPQPQAPPQPQRQAVPGQPQAQRQANPAAAPQPQQGVPVQGR